MDEINPEDEYVDMEAWEKCPHGYYINPDEPELVFRIVEGSDPDDPELEGCERCQIKMFADYLIQSGEDPESVEKFHKHQVDKIILRELLNGPKI